MDPTPMLSFLGAHALPVHLMTCPEVAPAWLSFGIVTAASFRSAVFTVVSRISAEVTAPSSIFADVTESAAIVGFG
jgi:hypothetical protein